MNRSVSGHADRYTALRKRGLPDWSTHHDRQD